MGRDKDYYVGKLDTNILVVGGTDITASILEVAAIDGLTASAAELNFNDTSVAGTAVASKTLVLGANKNVDVLAVADLKLGAGAGTSVTSTAAELNILTGVTASAAELNYNDITTLGTVQASKTITADANKMVTWAVSSATVGNIEPLVLATTLTGVGATGGRAKFTLDTNAALGGWSNALKGQVTYGATGKTTGLGSAVVAEMTLSAGTVDGTYAPVEIELNMGAAGVCGTATSLIYASVNDAAATAFDTNGYLLNLAGVTAGTSKMFMNVGTATALADFTKGLRVKVAGVDYVIPLITAAEFAS